MIKEAFTSLFPAKQFIYTPKVKYSRAFRGYNGNIRLKGNLIEVRLSREWKTVSKEIQIGLIQILLLKLFKEKKSTINIDLYNKFIKNLPRYSIVTASDPALEESFDRVNEQYFDNLLERPNLAWGTESFSKLGSYEYATDTITISTILRKDMNLLDYVMYHEMLHKKLQFNHKNGRSYHHTRKFKELEKKYHDPEAERKLSSLIRKNKVRGLWKFW
ncbi:MAG: hypothetical protein V1743_07605 [Nanoarchaeota archaeon]